MIIRRMPLFVLFYSLYLISPGPKLIKNIYYPKLLKTELYGNRKKTKNPTMEIDRKEAPTETKKGLKHML